MKGLFVKDICLLKNQKNFILLFVGFILLSQFASLDPLIVVSYTTYLVSIISLSTINYDEFDNGNPFLFSLPITRKSYLIEKYVFSTLMGLFAWSVAVVLMIVAQFFTAAQFDLLEWMFKCFIILMTSLLLNAVMVPINIKFGGEKGRVALFGVLIVAVIAGMGLYQIGSMWNIDWRFFARLSPQMLIVALFLSTILAIIISYCIGLRIMLKKEY